MRAALSFLGQKLFASSTLSTDRGRYLDWVDALGTLNWALLPKSAYTGARPGSAPTLLLPPTAIPRTAPVPVLRSRRCNPALKRGTLRLGLNRLLPGLPWEALKEGNISPLVLGAPPTFRKNVCALLSAFGFWVLCGLRLGAVRGTFNAKGFLFPCVL